MKKHILFLPGKLLAALLLLVFSCADKNWEEYYARPEFVKEGSVYELLAKNPDYRQFASLLRKTGLDSVLRRQQMFTVLALRNGAFTGIDTTANLAALKKMLGMHILPAAVYKDEMPGKQLLTVAGKSLRFGGTPAGLTVNQLPLRGLNTLASNGVVHEVEQVILPRPSLYEVIFGSADFSLFQQYINNSYILVADPEKNTTIGFDTLNQPIYLAPIIYKKLSDYQDLLRPDDEKLYSTMFIPTNQALNQVFARMLEARAGRPELVVPRLGTSHGDTTIGYTFIPGGMAYPGDSALLMDHIFRNFTLRGEVAGLASGDNTFTGLLGKPFVVNPAQVQGTAGRASNGTWYPLSEVSLPETLLRKTFMFQPLPRVRGAGETMVPNPNISYANGAMGPLNQESNGRTYTGKFTRFNFVKPGGVIEFSIPYATRGYYQVNLGLLTESNGGGNVYGVKAQVHYGSQLLRQELNTSNEFVSASFRNEHLGTIHVASDGPVKLTFTCTSQSPATSRKFEFLVDLIQLIPVANP